MREQIFRIRDLGEHGFWEIVHNLTQSPAPYDTNLLRGHKVCLVLAPEHHDQSLFQQALHELGMDVEVHNLTDLSLEALVAWGEGRQNSQSMHIAFGLTPLQWDVLTAEAGGAWLNGASPQSDPCGALAEVALFLELGQTQKKNLDQWRAAWIGKANGLAHSLMEAAIYAPFEFFMALPPSGDPDHDSTSLALKAGAKIFLTREPELALDGACIIYMDKELGDTTIAATPSLGQPFSEQPFDWSRGLVLSTEMLQRAHPQVVMMDAVPLPIHSGEAKEHDHRRGVLRLAAHKALLCALCTLSAPSHI